MNPKVVISSVAVLIIVVAIVIFRNPETIENINVPLTETTQKTDNVSILEEIFGGGGFGGGFGGGGGSGGGGGGGGGGGATTISIGGSTTSTTIPGGNSTTTTSIPGGTSTSTTSSSTSTSTSTTIAGGSSTTTTSIPGGTSTSTTSSSTSTSVTGCPSNFAIDYALDCKGTITESQDDELSVKVTNNEPTGYTFDVFVDGTSEGQTSAAGYGTFGLRYSSIMTNWWKAQSSSSSKSFSIRIDYQSGSCSMTRSVSVSFPPSSSQCGLD